MKKLVKKFNAFYSLFFLVCLFALLGSDQAFAYGSSQKWNEWFCIRNEICKVGDVNGDGKDDIIAFVHGDPVAGDRRNYVWVALSTGSSFITQTPWHGWFCMEDEICEVADVNGDGKDDLIAFVHDTGAGNKRGDVWVALSTGSGFATSHIWHGWFCIGDEICKVGDFNGDGLADILAIAGQNKAYISYSNGSGFKQSEVWDIESDHNCLDYLVWCEVGNLLPGREQDNIVVFHTTGISYLEAQPSNRHFGEITVYHQSGPYCISPQLICKPVGTGHVRFVHDYDEWGAMVQYVPFLSSTQVLHSSFCKGTQVCDIGDFNGDGIFDLIAFERGWVTWENRYGSGGDVFVALTGNLNKETSTPTPVTPPPPGTAKQIADLAFKGSGWIEPSLYPRSGEEITARFNFCNVGTAETGSFTIKLILDDSSEVFISAPSFAPGQCDTAYGIWPSGVGPGSHTVKIFLDVNDNVTEVYEDNNNNYIGFSTINNSFSGTENVPGSDGQSELIVEDVAVHMPPVDANCQLPTISEFYATLPPSDSTASYTLQYQVVGADKVEIFGNVLSPGIGTFDVFGYEQPTSWTLWAKVNGTPDVCYVENVIEVTVLGDR